MDIHGIDEYLRRYGVNTDEITFEQLFRLEDIQNIQDLFAEATGVASLITRPDGTPITRPSRFCRLCRDLIRKTELGGRSCYASDASIGRDDRAAGPVIRPCLSGGLWDAGSRISVGGRHLATWLIGQVRNEAQTEEGMRQYARKIGANEEEVIRAFREVPVMSREKLEQISRMLYTFANQLSLVAFQNIILTRIIADRELAGQELREKEERLRMIGNSIPSGMIYEAEVTPSGGVRILYVSEGVKRLHGCTVEEAMTDPNFIYDTIHPDDREEFHLRERKAIGTKGVFDIEFRARGEEGSYCWRRIISNARQLPGGTDVWVGIETDITPLKEAEESKRRLETQLNQSRKLEALGQLAGGVAHDLNNMLTPILGYAELLRERVSRGEPALLQEIDLIADAARRSSKLVQQLLIFARRQAVEFVPLDLNAVIRNIEPMLRRMLRENLDVSLLLSPDAGIILGDVGQLQQILINLAVNAQDAMPRGGQLIIRTARGSLDDPMPTAEGATPAEPCAVLTVTDTGCGMDEETRQKIFDPFFTTKGPGKGTGLGLATVYGIVKQHRGSIRVDTRLGEGTTFRIAFPLTCRCPEPLPDHPAMLPEGGAETILVVEDQEIVRTMVCEILQRSGYVVLSASSGEEAIRIVEAGLTDIHLLLSDVIMTGMNGPELYQRLAAGRPGLRGLFMSGYSSEILNHEGVAQGALQVIQKPFTPTVLLSRLREVLDGG
ncbi:MAG TPA: PocR ligand-binding domain-containing protein [Candidatus Ozemobacteraceae bacterium]